MNRRLADALIILSVTGKILSRATKSKSIANTIVPVNTYSPKIHQSPTISSIDSINNLKENEFDNQNTINSELHSPPPNNIIKPVNPQMQASKVPATRISRLFQYAGTI